MTWIASSQVMLVHGIIMIWAWGFLIFMGGAVARYVRRRPIRWTRWFEGHFGLQVCGAVMSFIGLILIIRHESQFPGAKHFRGWHPFMGLVVHILLVLQLLIGLMTRLKYFVQKLRLVHQIMAVALGITVLITIALGIDHFIDELKLAGAFSGWMIFAIYVLLVIISLIYLETMRSRAEDAARAASALEEEENPLVESPSQMLRNDNTMSLLSPLVIIVALLLGGLSGFLILEYHTAKNSS